MSKDLEIYLDGEFITSVPIDTKSKAEITIEYLTELYHLLFNDYIMSGGSRHDETKLLMSNFIDSIDALISFIENKELKL